MCIRHRRLTAVQARERHMCLEQLRSEGLDLGEGSDSFESWEDPCVFEIARSDRYAIISDFPPMNFAIAVPLRIIAHQQTTLEDCLIEVPWDESVHIASLRERHGSYHLGPFTYPAAEVLNDYFEISSTLSRGRTLEGVIAYGCAPIPDDIRSGFVPVRVTVADDLDREVSVNVRLMVRRASMNIMTASAGVTVDVSAEVACAREPHVPPQISDDVEAGQDQSLISSKGFEPVD